MTSWCKACGGICRWVSCPTGGWWAHLEHPTDDHAVDSVSATPHEWLTDDGLWMDDAGRTHVVQHVFVRVAPTGNGSWVGYCRCDYQTPELVKDAAWNDIGEHICTSPGGIFEILQISPQE